MYPYFIKIGNINVNAEIYGVFETQQQQRI